MSDPIRVVVADDSVLLRDGLVRLLEDAGMDVLAAVGDAEALLDAVATNDPDLAVIDVRMPPTQTDEGIRAAITIRADHPGVAVLVLSQYVEERYASELLANDTNGVGYLLKDRVVDVEDFVEAVRRVAGGGSAVDGDVVAGQLHVRADLAVDEEEHAVGERRIARVVGDEQERAPLVVTQLAQELHYLEAGFL